MIFNHKTPNRSKLIKYGFKPDNGKYVYMTEILDNQFKMAVTIAENGAVDTTLYEKETDEIYTLHLVSRASGEFVGRVREEYEKVLKDISDNCFEPDAYNNDLTHEIIEYVRNKYNDEPEYLWQKFPTNAVLRRKDNQKWYAALMIVPKNKLGLDSNENAAIIDIRFNEKELPLKIDGKRYFPGYHMNKKYWITILLDGSVPIEKICGYIDKSYDSVSK